MYLKIELIGLEVVLICFYYMIDYVIIIYVFVIKWIS